MRGRGRGSRCASDASLTSFREAFEGIARSMQVSLPSSDFFVIKVMTNLLGTFDQPNTREGAMAELRYRHQMRQLINKAVSRLNQGELSWQEAAEMFEAHHVPFAVTCRILLPYAA